MASLLEMRKSIDNIDNSIIAMLAERFKITDRVGLYKAENDLPLKDENREAEQYQCMTELAERYGIDPAIASTYLDTVIDAVLRKHRQIAAEYLGKISD